MRLLGQEDIEHQTRPFQFRRYYKSTQPDLRRRIPITYNNQSDSDCTDDNEYN